MFATPQTFAPTQRHDVNSHRQRRRSAASVRLLRLSLWQDTRQQKLPRCCASDLAQFKRVHQICGCALCLHLAPATVFICLRNPSSLKTRKHTFASPRKTSRPRNVVAPWPAPRPLQLWCAAGVHLRSLLVSSLPCLFQPSSTLAASSSCANEGVDKTRVLHFHMQFLFSNVLRQRGWMGDVFFI